MTPTCKCNSNKLLIDDILSYTIVVNSFYKTTPFQSPNNGIFPNSKKNFELESRLKLLTDLQSV